VIALEGRRVDAQRQDAAADAAASRVGKPLPKANQAEAKLQGEIDTAIHELQAVVDATQNVWAEFKAALVEYRPVWREQVQAALAKDIDKATKAYETARQAGRDVAYHRALLSWLSQADEALDGPRWELLRRFPSAVQPKQQMIVGQVPHSVDQVIGMLEAWINGEAA
jgi:hypothetical protein